MCAVAVRCWCVDVSACVGTGLGRKGGGGGGVGGLWADAQMHRCARCAAAAPDRLLLPPAPPPPAPPQAKGGAFTGDDKEFFRFQLGAHTVIPAFEEAVAGMKVGVGWGGGGGRGAADACCTLQPLLTDWILTVWRARGPQVGGIRRIIVPVELGYPNNSFDTLGPRPSTFSGACVWGG